MILFFVSMTVFLSGRQQRASVSAFRSFSLLQLSHSDTLPPIFDPPVVAIICNWYINKKNIPMDPFSITVGVISLVAISSRVGVELKKLRNGGNEATNNINAMLADLKALKVVLESIEEGFEELDSRTPLTGFIGTHWTALRTTLDDGCDSMDRLRTLLVHVNKDVRFLDSTRRAIRLKEANDQIAVYRQEIQAYKDAFQLSLQAVIL